MAWSVSKLGIQLKTTGMKSSYWLAGDAAYDCRNGLLTPWSQSQVNDPTCGLDRDSFNYYHSSSRMHVEQSFGNLMARFGIFWRPLRFHLRNVPFILHACMVLQNYCIDNNVVRLETTMSPQETQWTEEAFATWWRSGTKGVRDTLQGRRSDLETCDVRDVLTSQLKELRLMRPTINRAVTTL
jgi:DDE superfamily endonuclease